MKKEIVPIVESIIFSSENPVKLEDILKLLQNKDLFSLEVNLTDITDTIATLMHRYQGDEYGFELINIAEGYQFVSKAKYSTFVKEALLIRNRKKLSQAAMECLAIIAYRQPVTKADVEFIRGVNSDYAIQKLLEKNLIVILGKSDLPGRPLLYGTSSFFLEYLGIKSLSQLPKLPDIDEVSAFSLPGMDILPDE
ncbi:MAG: SMC-Scp complex subunit ScpB [Bacteroidia bacterium]|nr:SMC-Scp complex subunit ScpB [Bacteroidia bacterium]MDW8347751.1 SMC-Scp complex subunit ScpB [Bacteroidia bacterium]